jgi:NADPH-dependent curcumin reductase CurA
MTTNRQWVLRRRPEGEIQPGDLELIEAPVPDLDEGQLLVRNVYLSLDPTNRIWMADIDQYLPPVQLGDVMRGGTIGVVEQSRSDRFQPGQLVNPGLSGWSDYTVAHEGMTNPVPVIPGVPLPAFMSVLGMTGMTAWSGMLDIGKPQPGETVVVSAAAGAGRLHRRPARQAEGRARHRHRGRPQEVRLAHRGTRVRRRHRL